MARVSVIIPTYNQDTYISEAIDSVLNQTYQDFEIVITNDGSTDQTLQIIQEKQDPRIRYFSFSHNQGVSIAANHCIHQAKGELITILDSDNIFLPDKLEKQVNFLDKNPEFDAVFTHTIIIDKDGNFHPGKESSFQQLFAQKNKNRFQWLNSFFYSDNSLCNTSVLIKKKCYNQVGLYDPRLRQIHDLDFWIRLCLKSEIHILPEPLVLFRFHDHNISGVTAENMIRHTWEMSQVLEHYLCPEVSQNFYTIFPQQQLIKTPITPDDLKFLIAKQALNIHRPSHQYFGISTLYQLMNNPESAEYIEKKYSFKYTDLIHLTGNHDIFQIISNRKLKQDLDQTQKQLEAVQNHNIILQEKLDLPSETKSQPLVSILIPTYNGENFLSKAIKSALDQTYSNLEIIISDDGSTDRTVKIAESFQDNCSIPYRIITHSNYGLVKNLNFCIQQAQGKYIKFIFQDDWLESNCIEEMVTLAEQDPEIGLVFSPRQVLIDPDSKSDLKCQSAYNGAINLHQKWSDLKSIQSGEDLLSDPNCLIGGLNKIGEPTTVLISKRVFEELGEFDATLQQLLDVDMWFRIMGHYKIAFVNQTLSSLLIHKRQQTQVNIVKQENHKDYERLYLKIIQDSSYDFLHPSFKQIVLQKALFNWQFYLKLITNLLNQYQIHHDHRVRSSLQLVRQTLVQYWLTLNSRDLETQYSQEIRPIYQMLLTSNIVNQEGSEIEKSWIESIQKRLSQGLYSCDLIPDLMGIMLYKRAYELDFVYKNAIVPRYFFPEFITWLFAKVDFFGIQEDQLKYIRFQENLLGYITQNLNINSSSCDLWVYVSQCYLKYSQLNYDSVSEIELQGIYDYRNKILNFLVKKGQGSESVASLNQL
ncbi:glycosyltransferase family 2 protein [Planktothrix paucivesiculata]|uniref:Glycosyl transferase, family 2 n=1 Tax=Planktothrix paucivesiculata PCC 9631 TaxID=671071 RepID=A0A7Z9BE74_9CYAN